LLSTITAGNGIDLQVGGNIAAQVGTKDSQGNLQADRMTADGVIKGADRQQVSVTGSGAQTSHVLGNLTALGIRNGAADSFAPGAVSGGQAAMTTLLQNGLVSIRNNPDLQAVLAAPSGTAMTYRDASGKVQLTLAGQAKVQEVYSQLRLSETFREEHFADAGIAQVVTLVAAIALTVTTGGAGAAMIEAVEGTMSATMANAAFISMSSTMTGQLAGGASLGEAFEAGIKAGATSSVTAGLLNAPMVDTANGVQSINQIAGIQDVAGTGAKLANFDVANFDTSRLGQNLTGMATRGVVTAGVSTAINGGNFGDALKSSVVSDLAAVGANAVGQTGLSAGARALAHAGVGCAAAAANGKDCAAGAIGGAGASLINPLLDPAIGGADGSGWGNNPALRTATLQLGSMAVTGAVATALGKDGMTAALAAQNETLNNFLSNGHDLTAKQGTQVVDNAKNWIGTAYAPIGTPYAGPYAAMGIAADCSGSVCSIYGQAGNAYSYTTSRSFAAAAAREGFPFRPLISSDTPQLGDVVLYPGHLSIYTGNQTVLSAHRTGLPFAQFPTSYFGKAVGYFRYQLPGSPTQ